MDTNADVYLDVLKYRMRLDMLWPNEKLFVVSLLNYFEKFGNLTEKQTDAARRLAVRVICERDEYFGL